MTIITVLAALRQGCCCCCQVVSVVSDSVRPHRWQPTRLPYPWDSPGKNTGVGCHFLLQCMKVKSEVAQSCPTLSDPMDCSPPGSSVYGILQARVLEWVAIPFSRGSSQPKEGTWVSHIGGRFFTVWAIGEASLYANSYPDLFWWCWEHYCQKAMRSWCRVPNANKLKKSISDFQQRTRVGDHLSWNVSNAYTFKEVY